MASTDVPVTIGYLHEARIQCQHRNPKGVGGRDVLSMLHAFSKGIFRLRTRVQRVCVVRVNSVVSLYVGRLRHLHEHGYLKRRTGRPQ